MLPCMIKAVIGTNINQHPNQYCSCKLSGMKEIIPGCLLDFIFLVVIEFVFAENVKLIIVGHGYRLISAR